MCIARCSGLMILLELERIDIILKAATKLIPKQYTSMCRDLHLIYAFRG